MKRPAGDAPDDTDMHDLRAFCQVVDLGSVTAAARALGETKGTVSRRLTRLERALGVALVRRSPRRVEPTEEGAEYRARVGRALELLDDARAQLQQAHAAPHGHLRVTAPPDLGVSLLAPLVARFSEAHPGVTVELLLTEARLDFDAHQLDLALRATGSLQDSSLVAHKLFELDARFYAAPSYLARHAAPRRPADLERHRMVLGLAVARGRGTLSLRRAGDKKPVALTLPAAVSSSNLYACKEAAVAGAGVVLLPALVARGDVEAGRLVPVLESWSAFSGALYLVQHGSRFLQPKVRAFRDFVLDALGPAGRR